MPVRDPGSTSNRPPQMEEATPRVGAIAARRSEPGVCAVARSNCAGLTMWIAAEELMASRTNLDIQLVARQRLTGQQLNWRLVVGFELGRTSQPTRGSFLQCLPRLARRRCR